MTETTTTNETDSSEWGAPYDWVSLNELELPLSAFKSRCIEKYDGEPHRIEITLYDDGTFAFEASHRSPIHDDSEIVSVSEVLRYHSEMDLLEEFDVGNKQRTRPIANQRPDEYTPFEDDHD